MVQMGFSHLVSYGNLLFQRSGYPQNLPLGRKMPMLNVYVLNSSMQTTGLSFVGFHRFPRFCWLRFWCDLFGRSLGSWSFGGKCFCVLQMIWHYSRSFLFLTRCWWRSQFTIIKYLVAISRHGQPWQPQIFHSRRVFVAVIMGRMLQDSLLHWSSDWWPG